MPFLSSLAEDAHLIDVFKKFPGLYRPLIEYHEILPRCFSPHCGRTRADSSLRLWTEFL